MTGSLQFRRQIRATVARATGPLTLAFATQRDKFFASRAPNSTWIRWPANNHMSHPARRSASGMIGCGASVTITGPIGRVAVSGIILGKLKQSMTNNDERLLGGSPRDLLGRLPERVTQCLFERARLAPESPAVRDHLGRQLS